MINQPQFGAKSLALILLSLIMLGGCGGGGGSSTPDPIVVIPPDTTTPEPEPEPAPTELTITALDGYLENALVYIDLNENYSFDNGEPQAMTDANGNATLNIAGIDNALLIPIIVEAMKGQTIDHSTFAVLSESYTLVAPGGSAVVSPLTTLAQLSLLKDQLVNIDAAIAAVKIQLGLPADSDIMADYLSGDTSNEQLHAIARSIVQLLPADASTLFTEGAAQQTIQTLFVNSSALSTAINDAIAQGADPLALFANLTQNGSATATELTVEDAITFIGDVRVWGEQINSGFIQSLGEFAQKIDVAAQVVKSDASELLSMLLTYSEGGLIAVKAGIYHEINAALLVPGSTGTVITSFNGETQDATIQISAELEGKTVLATLTVNTETALQTSVVAQLNSDTVRILINEGSSLTLNSETYLPEQMQLSTVVDTKTDDSSVDPVHFVGVIAVDSVVLTKSTGEETASLLNNIDLVGSFEVNNQESFSAELHLLTQPALVDDEVVWSELKATLQVDANLNDAPGAFLLLEVTLADAGNNNVTLTLIYNTRSVTFSMAIDGNAVTLTAINKKGITMTLALTLQQNDDALGTLTIGAKQIAAINRVDGVYKVTFGDGQIEDLF